METGCQTGKCQKNVHKKYQEDASEKTTPLRYVSENRYHPPVEEEEDENYRPPPERRIGIPVDHLGRKIMCPRVYYIFSKANRKHNFVRGVYILMLILILISSAFSFVALLLPDIGAWMAFNWWLFVIIIMVDVVVYGFLTAMDAIKRKFPRNAIFLFFLSMAKSYILGFITAVSNSFAILFILGLFFIMVFSLLLFTCQKRYNFSGGGPYVLVIFEGLVLTIGSYLILRFFIHFYPILAIIQCGLAAILLGFLLICDTQKLIEGRHGTCLSPQNYLIGASSIYSDTCFPITLCKCCLRMTGNR